jgi:hypothetical protein
MSLETADVTKHTWITAAMGDRKRGPDAQVVLDGSPERDGAATHIFWSGTPKL